MYQFTDDCLLGVEELDNEHRRLFQMINEAITLSDQTEDVTRVAQNLLLNVKDYVNTHFAHEEAYMEKIQDPELPLQKKQHAAFAEKINGFSLDTSSPEAAKASLNKLLGHLVRWLYNHILSSDMLIGKMKPLEEANDDPFAFTTKFMTGVPLIDNEHRRLFEIIKATNDLIHEQLLYDKYDEIMRLLSDLRDYTEFHFKDEEQLMTRINYPGLDAQKRAHTSFVERLVEIDLSELDDMDDNQQEYLLDLVDYLLSWLQNHIIGTDKKVGEFMRENNIDVNNA